MEYIINWVRKYYNKTIHSIAFYPAIIALLFLLVAIIANALEETIFEGQLKEMMPWLEIKDPSTIRTIIATVAAGILSLMVFSFSMVMIVMNQAASQMSNRMLDNLIGNSFQKTVLGFYIGTIVYAFYMLSTINETDAGFAVSISIYILMIMTIFDIFVFVYFLHYITQSFRYEYLIKLIFQKTKQSLTLECEQDHPVENNVAGVGIEIKAPFSGYYQGINKEQLLKQTVKEDWIIQFLHAPGAYVLEGTPLLTIESKNKIDDTQLKKLFLNIDFYHAQEIDKNSYYGFYHLSEVAVKALSPGINDPGTAVLSIHALTDLFAYRMFHHNPTIITDSTDRVRIRLVQKKFSELFEEVIMPIYDYGSKDRLIKKALRRLIEQLSYLDRQNHFSSSFKQLQTELEKEP